MNRDDAISVESGDEDSGNVRRAILETPIRNVVEALGGYEEGRYRLGDECYGCLKDLKKFWRKDDTDDERTVARLFWETRVLPNDLVPILLETAGKGMFEDKRAIACADLMTAMTWPIDMAEELLELDEVLDKGTDYTQLIQSHLHYKAALLKPGVMEALFAIILPCLAKDVKERTERDIQIIGVVLYLVRNLAFIKDPPANMHTSADQAEYSSLQSRLIKVLSGTHILDLLLTLASNAGTDTMFNGWNTLVLEIFNLLFRGVKPSSLSADQSKEPTQNLKRLLAVEDKRKRDIARNASSRHSRFGTTISVTLNPKKSQNGGAENGAVVEIQAPEASSSSQAFVLHRQQAINHKIDKYHVLAFLASLLKDIKAERPKITEKDNLRLLYIMKWFLEFFLCQRVSDKEQSWSFGLVAEVAERNWIGWVLKRMRQAMEEKPKSWTELQAGVECLTQLVLLIDGMCSSGDPSVADVAEVLQTQIIYNGEVLDNAFESLRVYKEGTQSLAYLDSSVYLAYALLRLLERSSKKERGAYVRKKAKRKSKGKRSNDDSGVPEHEDESEEEEEITETMFTFDAFEQRFAHPDVTQTLMLYLARYKEFHSPENMKRIVNLLHRQAVKAKAEGLFFKVSTLDLFKNILSEEKSLPKEQAYKDLVNLINYILRKFFKAVEEDSFLMVEAFFPKNRGKWKQLSSWEPPEKNTGPQAYADESLPSSQWPAEVKIKKGFTWSQEMGIAIACLVDNGKMTLIDWIKQILIMVIGQRQRIIEDTDGSSSQQIDLISDNEDEAARALKLREASREAIAKFTDYMIPYVSDEQADAATKDPHVKLMFRLLNFALLQEDAEELEWYVPQAIVPSELQRSLNIINQFLEEPIDLGGKKAAQMLHKKRRTRRRRRAETADSEEEHASDDEPTRKRKEKKKKEHKQYKSAQFIEDSDIEDDALDAFFAREKELREKMALASVVSGKIATMKATGTKKRRNRNEDKGSKKRKRGVDGGPDQGENKDGAQPAIDSDTDSEEAIFNPFASPKQVPSTARTSPESGEEKRAKPKPRPRPRLRAQRTPSPPPNKTNSPQPEVEPSTSGSRDTSPLNVSSDDADIAGSKLAGKKRKPMVISDDEE
ncbi:hypothetical protein EW026_g2191 [Hermanssonia centrifuga]|uniref:Timeless N-terminal domain-containing protein n=1 Tax=Hermanssonia centrifuga TaxID=98765 RepID=A0A4V3XB21_9APHY|nr:hypothetical protein EW026_g2191 [Hermanssonia centrifuga]